MIERYSLPEMRSLWTEKRKLEIWLEIETLACEAMAELGTIPKEDAAEIRAKGPSISTMFGKSKNARTTM